MTGTAGRRGTGLRAWLWLWAVLPFVAAVGLLPALPAQAAAFAVNSTADTDDGGNCSSGTCTLREAIRTANANNNQPGFDTITFSFSGTTVRTFSIASVLPSISEPLIIDGRSHEAVDGKPLIKFDGLNGDYDGIRANAGGSAQATGVWLLSLMIVRFGQNGVEFNSTGGNIVSNCYIGIDTAGTDLGNGMNGVRINGSDNNIIGPLLGSGGNFISGNGAAGVLIERVVVLFPPPPVTPQQGTGNIISGNRIGTNPGTTSARANGTIGVHITRAGNTVGGTTFSEINVIAGNGSDGVRLSGAAASGNIVSGNYIGTNGISAIPNIGNGVLITEGAFNNVIGSNGNGVGYCGGPCNLISGNGGNGIFINESGGNAVRGNVIGLTSSLTVRLPNALAGVRSGGNSSGNIIGGFGAGEGNVIAGNGQYGIQVSNASVEVRGNYVGTNHLGAAGLFNASGGMFVTSSNCVIGGSTITTRNVVSGNSGFGIFIAGGTGCQVTGNYIGLRPDGQGVLSNGDNGITDQRLFGTTVTIGGPGGAGNIISGNNGHGISLNSGGALVRGNTIGLNATGTTAVPNSDAGVFIGGSSSNTIGGLGAGEGNVISGNTLSGIEVKQAGQSILGNIIGLDSGGSVARPNGRSGILLDPVLPVVPGSTIRGNTISGNNQHGIQFRAGSTGDVVAGNRIGTNVLGTVAVPNNLNGISVATPGVLIGGSTVADRNVISGNKADGIYVSPTGSGAVIKGNFVGLNAAGTAALPNRTANGVGGVFLEGAGATVGGLLPAEANVISGNNGTGVGVNGSAAQGNSIIGNRIGTNPDGTAAIPNVNNGVAVFGAAPQVRIGQPGAGNLISGNGGSGVLISVAMGEAAVEANLIGTNAGGTTAIPNGLEGVYLFNAGRNTIGGMSPGAGNVISGNVGRGIRIEGADATANTVQGNFIGTNGAGTAALANGNHGIHLFDGAHDNVIGGVTTAARNIISGNGGRGIYLFGNTTSGNSIFGNYIGTDITGAVDVGNGDGGVVVEDAPNTTIGGGDVALRGSRSGFSSAGNVISGNVANGVELNGDATNGIVRGNFIGTDVTGTFAIPNDLDGVRVAADGAIIGGKNAGQANLISGNKADGIRIQGAATGTVVQGNGIGTRVDGVSPLPNGSIGAPNDHGIRIFMNATLSVIGGTAEGEANVIAFNPGDGVRVEGANAIKHAIRGNSIHSNGGKGIETSDGGNTELPPPVILAVGSASGTACANCFVDVFSDSVDEGRIYEGSVQASAGGAWSFAGAVSGPFVTATATDANGNTSEFSAPVAFVPPNPVPSLLSLVPPSATAGGPGFTLTINGANFVAGATVQFGGGPDKTPLTTTSGVITVTISAADIAVQGPYTVTVTNPSPCVASSCVSNSLVFNASPAGGGDTTFPLFNGATGHLWTGNPVPLAQLGSFVGARSQGRAFTAVTALFRWENTTQQFQFWFDGFPDNFQTLTGGLQTGQFYFFQSPGNTIVTVPNGTLFTVPAPGGSFQTVVGATAQLWSGSPVPLAQLDDALPPGLPATISAVFRWENNTQQFQFFFRGFPDNFQTLAAGLVHGEFYFFQSTQGGVNVPMN